MKFVILDTRIYVVCIFVKVINVHIEFLSVKLLYVLQYIIMIYYKNKAKKVFQNKQSLWNHSLQSPPSNSHAALLFWGSQRPSPFHSGNSHLPGAGVGAGVGEGTGAGPGADFS